MTDSGAIHLLWQILPASYETAVTMNGPECFATHAWMDRSRCAAWSHSRRLYRFILCLSKRDTFRLRILVFLQSRWSFYVNNVHRWWTRVRKKKKNAARDCSQKKKKQQPAHTNKNKKNPIVKAKAMWTNICYCAPISLLGAGVCEVYFVIVWKMAYLSETVKGRRFIKLGAIRKSYRHVPIKWKACNIQETRDGSRSRICAPAAQSLRREHDKVKKTQKKQDEKKKKTKQSIARCPQRGTSRVTCAV